MQKRFLQPKNTEPGPTVFTVFTIPPHIFHSFKRSQLTALSLLSLSVFYCVHVNEMASTQHDFIANKMVSQWFECGEQFLHLGSGTDFGASGVSIQQLIRWHSFEKGR